MAVYSHTFTPKESTWWLISLTTKTVNGKSGVNVLCFGFEHLIPAVIITLDRVYS